MEESRFMKLIDRFIEKFCVLAQTITPEMTPFDAVKLIKESKLLFIMPYTTELSMTSNWNGSFWLNSILPSRDCVYIKGTPETKEAASKIDAVNNNSAAKAEQYLKFYINFLPYMFQNRCHVDTYILNNGAEKMYVVYPFDDKWIKEPCVLYFNERSAWPNEQYCRISVPYPTIDNTLAKVNIDLDWQSLAIEEAFPLIRNSSLAEKFTVHDLSISSDGIIWHVSVDGKPLYEDKRLDEFSYDDVIDLLTIDFSEMIKLENNDSKAEILQSGPYYIHTISRRLLNKVH